MSGLEVREEGKTTIFTFNRPEIRNAIDGEMFETLHRKFAEFDASDQRVAVLTGTGENFWE